MMCDLNVFLYPSKLQKTYSAMFIDYYISYCYGSLSMISNVAITFVGMLLQKTDCKQ